MNLLIVEDDMDILDFLQHAYTKEGFVVDTASEGRTGLQKARTHAYDLIVLDYNLPHKNAHEICHELRSAAHTARILILSVNSALDTKVKLLNEGADDYLEKPFAFSELLARSRALLRRPEQITEKVLMIGTITLDTSRHIATCCEKEILLTPKEFALLEYFMRNYGRIVSRMSILEHVWGVNADPFTNTIETHILNLRKKLGDKNNSTRIHTISGVGYKLY